MITTLSQLIALVESNGQPSAVRFEPAYHPDDNAFPLIRKYHPGLSMQTYETILASSWGKYQIMGDNLYLLGLSATILDFWKDEAMQDIFFLRFCSRRNIAYTLDEVLTDETKRQNFAHHYNGNTLGYSARMMQVYNSSIQSDSQG